MKLLIVLAITLLCVVAYPDLHKQWIDFKLQHGKGYKNAAEEKYRFNIFQENLLTIKEHNIRYQNGEVAYYLGINKFADQSPAEFRSMLMTQKLNKPELEAPVRTFPENIQLPQVVDWREKGAILKVKDQGYCGSCWAFSATGTIEAQNVLINNVSIPLSEQQLVDCSFENGSDGCKGGDMRGAFYYVQHNGLQSEEDYPYEAEQKNCKESAHDPLVKTLFGYEAVEQLNEAALLHAVAVMGPVSIGINADLLQLYQGGIFDNTSCPDESTSLNHGVLAVAYNLNAETPYWVVKNSWGANWGEEGFIRMIEGHNICGITWNANFVALV